MKDFQDTLKESMESILEPLSSKAPQGINTGFYRFDNILQGMNKGMLTVLASKSGTGKTSFALNIIKNLISQQAKILFVSGLESTEITSRLLAIASGVPKKYDAAYSYAEMLQLISAEENLKKLQLSFMDSRLADDVLYKEISDYHAAHNFDLLIADDVRIADCRRLKTLAEKQNIAVLALVATNSPKDEILLKGKTDTLVFLKLDREKTSDPDLGIPMELVISKNKQGHCGTSWIYMITPVMLFKESRISREPFVVIPDVYTPIRPYTALKNYITPEHLPLLDCLHAEIPQEDETLNLSDVLNLSACLEAVGDHENAVKVFLMGRKKCHTYEKGAEVIFDWMFAAMYYWLFLDMPNANRCMGNAKELLDSRTLEEFGALEDRIQKYRPSEWIKDEEIC